MTVASEKYDTAALTYTAWDEAGAVVAQRPLSASEQEQLVQPMLRESNAAVLRQQAAAALVANRVFIATAKPGTAAAQASAAYDQAKANTRAINGVIRMLLGQFDGTD